MGFIMFYWDFMGLDPSFLANLVNIALWLLGFWWLMCFMVFFNQQNKWVGTTEANPFFTAIQLTPGKVTFPTITGETI